MNTQKTDFLAQSEKPWQCRSCGIPMHPPEHGCNAGPAAFDSVSREGWCSLCFSKINELEEEDNIKVLDQQLHREAK